MAFTLLQEVASTATGASPYAVTLPSNLTVGSLLIVCACDFTGHVITSMAGGGVTWNSAEATVLSAGGVGTAEIWAGYNSTGGAGVKTITATATSATNAGMWVGEYSGSLTTNPFDVGGVTTNVVSATPTTASITPGAVNELIIACAAGQVAFTAAALTNGFSRTTAMASFKTTMSSFFDLCFLIDSAASAITAGFTMGSSSEASTAIASFKVATAAAAPIVPRPDSRVAVQRASFYRAAPRRWDRVPVL